MNDFLREVIQPQILKCGCVSNGHRDTFSLNRAHSLFTEPQSGEVSCGKSSFLGKQAVHRHHKTHPWMIIVHQKSQKQKKRDCNARWVTLPPREKREARSLPPRSWGGGQLSVERHTHTDLNLSWHLLVSTGWLLLFRILFQTGTLSSETLGMFWFWKPW